MGRPIRYTPGELTTAALRANTLLGFADDALVPVNAGELVLTTRPLILKANLKNILFRTTLLVLF